MKVLLSIFSILLVGCGSKDNTANVNGCHIAIDAPADSWELSVEDCHYDKEMRCHACVFVYKDNAKFQCVPGAPVGGHK